MIRIHIVGSGPRTGTTLLTEAMHTCFEIDSYCEHEASICTDEPDIADIFLTKSPNEISAIKWPLKLNPDLYVICVIRDPRDSIVSKHGSRPNVYWTGLRYWKQFIKYFPELSDCPRFIHFKYEDLVNKPDEVQNYIKANIPMLKVKHNFSEYHKYALPSTDSINALKSVRPIAPAGVGNWKKHLPRIKEQIMIHGSISEELQTHGYEENNDWIELLKSVELKKFEQHGSQFILLREWVWYKKNEFVEVINIALRKMHISPRLIKPPFFWMAKFIKFVIRPIARPIMRKMGW